MWRRPLVWSLVAHVLLGLAFWYGAGKVDLRPPAGLPPLDTRVYEEEINVMVSDIGTAPVVQPAPTASEGSTLDPSLALGAGAEVAPEVTEKVPQAHEGSTTDASLGGLTPPVRPSSTTTFFQIATPARSVVYVIDRSGSMGAGGRLALARHELLASLERLPPSARFQVVAYNRRSETLRIDGKADLVPAISQNKDLAAHLLETLVPEGGTDHRAALETALRLQPEAIYFLTDADDLPADLVRTLTQLNHGRTTIHAIELTAAHRDRPDLPLHVLARENRGSYQYVDVK